MADCQSIKNSPKKDEETSHQSQKYRRANVIPTIVTHKEKSYFNLGTDIQCVVAWYGVMYCAVACDGMA